MCRVLCRNCSSVVDAAGPVASISSGVEKPLEQGHLQAATPLMEIRTGENVHPETTAPMGAHANQLNAGNCTAAERPPTLCPNCFEASGRQRMDPGNLLTIRTKLLGLKVPVFDLHGT